MESNKSQQSIVFFERISTSIFFEKVRSRERQMKDMSHNDLEMRSQTITNRSQSSSKTSSKKEVNSEGGLRRGWNVWQDSPGVNFAREGGDLGGWDYYFPTRRAPFRERSADYQLTYWSPEASYREFNNSRHICI